jgi:hypothetical protein
LADWHRAHSKYAAMFSLENLQKTLKFYYNMTFSRLQEKCPTDGSAAKQHFVGRSTKNDPY